MEQKIRPLLSVQLHSYSWSPTGENIRTQVRSFACVFQILTCLSMLQNFISMLSMNHLSIVLPHKQVDPPLLSGNRASAHHCYHWTGCQPTSVTAQAKARLLDRAGWFTPIHDRTSDMSSSIRVQTITGKHCFNYIISLFYWNELKCGRPTKCFKYYVTIQV